MPKRLCTAVSLSLRMTADQFVNCENPV